jgi:hypothetical protein
MIEINSANNNFSGINNLEENKYDNYILNSEMTNNGGRINSLGNNQVSFNCNCIGKYSYKNTEAITIIKNDTNENNIFNTFYSTESNKKIKIQKLKKKNNFGNSSINNKNQVNSINSISKVKTNNKTNSDLNTNKNIKENLIEENEKLSKKEKLFFRFRNFK